MENSNYRSQKSKTLTIIFVSFLCGALLTHLFDRYIFFSPIGNFFRAASPHFSSSFFSNKESMDPFEQMQKMQEKIFENNLGGRSQQMGNNHFSLNTEQISTEEDEHNYFYVINPDGMDVKDFKSDISGGVLTLSAQFVKNDQGMSMSSQMHQSFPLPENADAEKMDIQNKDNKIVIRIPKK